MICYGEKSVFCLKLWQKDCSICKRLLQCVCNLSSAALCDICPSSDMCQFCSQREALLPQARMFGTVSHLMWDRHQMWTVTSENIYYVEVSRARHIVTAYCAWELLCKLANWLDWLTDWLTVDCCYQVYCCWRNASWRMMELRRRRRGNVLALTDLQLTAASVDGLNLLGCHSRTHTHAHTNTQCEACKPEWSQEVSPCWTVAKFDAVLCFRCNINTSIFKCRLANFNFGKFICYN